MVRLTREDLKKQSNFFITILINHEHIYQAVNPGDPKYRPTWSIYLLPSKAATFYVASRVLHMRELSKLIANKFIIYLKLKTKVLKIG